MAAFLLPRLQDPSKMAAAAAAAILLRHAPADSAELCADARQQMTFSSSSSSSSSSPFCWRLLCSARLEGGESRIQKDLSLFLALIIILLAAQREQFLHSCEKTTTGCRKSRSMDEQLNWRRFFVVSLVCCFSRWFFFSLSRTLFTRKQTSREGETRRERKKTNNNNNNNILKWPLARMERATAK